MLRRHWWGVAWVRIRSSRVSAPAEWAKCIAPATPSSDATSRSRSCRARLRATRNGWRVSSAKRGCSPSLNHPNIGAIYGLEDADGDPALVLELVDGETLADRIARGPAVAQKEALPIARQITEALDAAHEKGIVHRDLKPSEREDDAVRASVKVLDFGLAKAIDGDGGDRICAGADDDHRRQPARAWFSGPPRT